MPSSEPTSGSALGEYFVGDITLAEVLEKICQAALDAVEPARLAGISMTVDARIGTYIFTHPEVQDVDRSQYDTGDGPCVDAFHTGDVVIIDSTLEPGPYVAFRTVAVDHGLLSTMSVPMHAGEALVGALNLYAPNERAFSGSDQKTALSFATQAAYVLLNHQAYWDAKSLSESLTQAMQSRAQIEQAKGIIVAATGCTPDEAYDRLREQSQAENIKLRDIAARIVQDAQRKH